MSLHTTKVILLQLWEPIATFLKELILHTTKVSRNESRYFKLLNESETGS